jgi:HK97 family phage major capsid protein
MKIDALERELDAKKAEGLALLERTTASANAEDRLFTEAEDTAIKAVIDQGRALQAKIAKAKGGETMLAEIERLTLSAARTSTAPLKFRSLGEQFVGAKEYDFFKAGGHRSQSAWRSPSVELDPYWGLGSSQFRAATLTEDPASGGALVIPQHIPGILPLLTKRLVVADLLASGTTDSNAVAYMKEKVFTNAAAAVLEGGIKPESTLTFEAALSAVRKIAHWLPVTEEMLEDVAQIRSYIDARLRLGVQIEEEDQLLNGDGIAPNLLGLRMVPGLAPDVVRAAAEPSADAILRQIMAIFGTSFLMPDGIVMSPADWATVLLTKGGQGQYLTGGPFASIQSATLWGLPVAVTPSIEPTVALVGAFKQAAQIFRKGGIRVEASNSHSDFFIKNLVAIRAEERLALAVYRPAAIGEVTGLGAVVAP